MNRTLKLSEKPEMLHLPKLKKRSQKGRVLTVQTIMVGGQGGPPFWPAIRYWEKGELKIALLPMELYQWALECVTFLHPVELPCHIEFGILRGRPYAEFLD